MKRKKVLVLTAVMMCVMISGCGADPSDPGLAAPGTQVESRQAEETSEESEKTLSVEGDKVSAAERAVAKTASETEQQEKMVVQTAVNGAAATEKPASGPADFAASVVRTSEDDLFPQVSPETSAMTFYTYDGKTVHSSFIYDRETEQKILDALSGVKAEKAEHWTPADASLPVYGIEIGRKDGWSILAAWSNGYWLAQDGSVYRFDFDFEELARQAPWEDERELPSFTSFPCARLFTQEGDGWNTKFLVPAPKLDPPKGITMTLDAWEGDNAVVILSNESGEDFSFGEFFEVQVRLGDVWYEIPTVPGNWGFGCLGYYLPAGESQNMTHHMSMYGTLPSGTYRIVLNGLTAEYTVP